MSRAEALPARRDDGGAKRSGWQTAKRWLLPVFVLLVLGLLVSHLRDVDWAGAWKALRAYEPAPLWTAAALTALSFLLYGCFDLIGRQHVGHRLSAPRTWLIAFTSYAFNLNLGSLVGSLGMRWRLYTSAGLDGAQITQVIALSLATNWLGYGALAGLLFASGLLQLPADYALSNGALRVIGVAMLGVVAAYLWACGWSKKREGTLRGHRWELPSGREALMQLVLSSANWAVMGCVMWVLLGQAVAYPLVLAVLLTGAIAGVATHVPANLGVLEAIFLALLGGGELSQGTILGAVLAYRAIYYLAPMGLALVSYLSLEGLGRRGKA